eukprot:15447622-Alexandrium_andersonii.AAC.1
MTTAVPCHMVEFLREGATKGSKEWARFVGYLLCARDDGHWIAPEVPRRSLTATQRLPNDTG